MLQCRLDTEYYIHLKEFNLRFAIILVTNENPKTGEILPTFNLIYDNRMGYIMRTYELGTQELIDK